MKLRNKKTGIIGELHFEPDKEYHFTVVTEDPADVMIYKKLADLYADWEDYEEPKEYWFIDCDGEIMDGQYEGTGFDKDCKAIGNYFNTREEAERTVEKLKAYKRLKDKGFRFNNFVRDTIYYEISDEEIKKDIVRNDLELLFGGDK